jgi:hypothetical protein
LDIPQLLPKQDLRGKTAWFANEIVACHVLTGVAYRDMMGAGGVLDRIMDDVNGHGFNFAIPVRECGKLNGRGPPVTSSDLRTAYEQAYRAVFYASAEYHDSLGIMSLASFFGQIARINMFLEASVLRSALPWRPMIDNPPDPCQWFFVTVQQGNVQLMWDRCLQIEPILRLLPHVQGFVFYLCRQQTVHVHGLFLMAVPCRLAFVRSRFAAVPGASIEPVRARPAAALTYMENQAILPPALFPHGGFPAGCREHQAIFERALSGDIKHPWPAGIMAALKGGTPWYALKRHLSRQAPAHRALYRAAGRAAALARRRTWDVAIDTVPREALDSFVSIAVRRFGVGSARVYTPANAATWSGQPVLICMSREDLEHCSHQALLGRWAITNIIHVVP